MHSGYNKGRRHYEAPSPATDDAQIQHALVAQIAVEVKFGMVSRNCDNYGVCHIDATTQLLKDKNLKTSCCFRKTTAVLSVNRDGGIELAFPKSAMKVETENMFFSQLFFKVEENFELSNELTEQFQLKNRPIIIRGNYRISSTMGFYLVRFF
jgi:hypothetical protein